MGGMGIFEVNARFNEELKLFEELPCNHVFNLGKPSPILQACGFSERLDIQLTRGKVRTKLAKHQFELSLLRNLPILLQDPLLVSRHAKEDATLNVVVEKLHYCEKTHEWQPLLVGIELHKRHGSRRGVEFHNVRSVFPKNLESLRWWISRSCGGKGKPEGSGSPVVYLSKERLRAISHARGTICPAGRIARSLDAKVIKDFDNPIGEAEVLAFRQSLDEAERVWLAEGRQAFYDKQGINGVNAMGMNKQSSSAEKNSSARNNLREMHLSITTHNDWIPYFKIMREKGFLDNEDEISYSKSFKPIRAYINRERPKRSYIDILSSDREKWNAGIKYLEVFEQIYKKTFTKRAEKLKLEIKKRGRDAKNLTEYLINRTKEKEEHFRYLTEELVDRNIVKGKDSVYELRALFSVHEPDNPSYINLGLDLDGYEDLIERSQVIKSAQDEKTGKYTVSSIEDGVANYFQLLNQLKKILRLAIANNIPLGPLKDIPLGKKSSSAKPKGAAKTTRDSESSQTTLVNETNPKPKMETTPNGDNPISLPALRKSNFPASNPYEAKASGKAKSSKTNANASQTAQPHFVNNTPSTAVKFLKRLLAMDGKPIDWRKVETLLRSLQKAIVSKEIRKTDRHAKLINRMQEALVIIVNEVNRREVKVLNLDALSRQKIVEAVNSEVQSKALTLLRAYVALHQTEDKVKAERVLSRMQRAVHAKEINEELSRPIALAMKTLYRFIIDKSSKRLEIGSFQLNGLMGLLGIDAPAALGGVCAVEGEVYSGADVQGMQFNAITLEHRFARFLGRPEFPFRMMVHGGPGSGKTTFALQLANSLAAHNGKRVLFVSSEEGIGQKLQAKIERLGLRSPSLYYASILPDNYADYDAIFIDSVISLGLTAEALRTLYRAAPHAAFVVINQDTKDGKARGSLELMHDVDISCRCENLTASLEKNRYGDTSKNFAIIA